MKSFEQDMYEELQNEEYIEDLLSLGEPHSLSH